MDDVEVGRHTAQLAGTVDQVPEVRRMLAKCLGPEHPCLNDAQLLATEASANAVTHSASAAPGGHFTVAIEWTAESVVVIVTDQGATTVPYRMHAQPHDTSGRGIDLIDKLSHCWGLSRRRAVETRVWFELSAIPDGGALSKPHP
jgi:anti-sigma regulatory factor (Ser/Thr protein kinase)